MIVDTGGTVSLAAPVEMMGHGMPPSEVPRPGFEPSLSVDVETNVPSDMFNHRCDRYFRLQRAFAVGGVIADHRSDVLAYTTPSRAPGQMGSMPRWVTDARQASRHHHAAHGSMNVTPLGDPATAVVMSMDTGNVDTVLTRAESVKRGPTAPCRLPPYAAEPRSLGTS